MDQSNHYVESIQNTYPEIETFWERITFYRGTFALLEALFGIENQNQIAFKSGIGDYI